MLGKLNARWQRVVELASRERFLIGASLFRIVAGLTILHLYLANYFQRHYLYGPDGVWPFARSLEEARGAGAFSIYVLSGAPLYFEVVFHLGILFTMLWVVGFRTRLMSLLTYVWLWSLHQRNPVLLDGGDNIIRLALLYGVFAELGAFFSLDADRLRAQRARGGDLERIKMMTHSAAILACAVQVCLVYGIAGLYKVQGELWQNGTALYYITRVGEFTWPGHSEGLYGSVALVTALTYAAVAFQLSFPFLFVLDRRTRRLALAGAFTFHLGIAVMMGLVTFAAFMISVELALISDAEYRAVGAFSRRLLSFQPPSLWRLLPGRRVRVK
ncbi:HTTM domain-containing protein [Sorangium sp. So ce1153]|uniref:HTTM domain-containing protein n=1 Tax=Sorangium sp. So ce1153 TaxID=3133333 RepID=UPI003F63CEDB